MPAFDRVWIPIRVGAGSGASKIPLCPDNSQLYWSQLGFPFHELTLSSRLPFATDSPGDIIRLISCRRKCKTEVEGLNFPPAVHKNSRIERISSDGALIFVALDLQSYERAQKRTRDLR
ncbi:hypothetical protein ABW21_db0201214 [Orbilia brochopaga]|nr:hypothetical protein ABW21_db0201214 [Drechslerella brochopaga]